MILVALVGAIISHDVNIALSSSFGIRRATSNREFTVGLLLWILVCVIVYRCNISIV